MKQKFLLLTVFLFAIASMNGQTLQKLQESDVATMEMQVAELIAMPVQEFMKAETSVFRRESALSTEIPLQAAPALQAISPASANVIFSEDFGTATTPSALPWEGWTGIPGACSPWGVSAGVGSPAVWAGRTGRALTNFWSDGCARNSWAISPSFELEEGVTYLIEFWVLMPGFNTERDHLRVMLAQAPTADAMLAGFEVYVNTTTAVSAWTRIYTAYTPTATAMYHLGFHAFTPTDLGDLIRIDDILIEEMNANDLAILRVQLPHAHIPVHQATTTLPQELSVTVQNVGTANQTNVTMSAELNGNSIGAFSVLPTLESLFRIHTFSSPSGTLTAPAVLGNNQITFEVTQAETDQNPSNNIFDVAFTGTRDVYRADELVGASVALATPAANTFWGHVYTITEPTILDRVRFGVRNMPAGGTAWPVFVSIFKMNEDGSVPVEPMYIDGWNIPAGSFGFFSQPIDEPIMLLPGSYFVAMSSTVAGTNNNPANVFRQFVNDLSSRGTMARTLTGTQLLPQAGGANLMSLFLPEEDASISAPTVLNVTNIEQTTATVSFDADAANRVVVFNTLTGEHVSGLSGATTAGATATSLNLTGLTSGTQYTVRIVSVGGLQSTGGAFPAQRSPWLEYTFTTGFDLAVASLLPADEATNVALDASVTVTFNQNITAGDLSGITFSPSVAGVSASISGAVLTIAHADFAEDTEYTVTIPAGAIAGFDEVITWSFTTEKLLAVVSLSPADGATDVALDASVTVTFNQDITAGNLNGITFSPSVAGVSASVSGAVLTIAHADFAEGIQYTVTVPAGAIVGLSEAVIWSFTTSKSSVNVPTHELGSLVIYPNPVQDRLYIQSPARVNRVEVYSLLGNLVKIVENNVQQVPVGNLTSGVYMIRIITDEGIVTQRFVKE